MVQLIRLAAAFLALTIPALAVDFSDPKSVVEAAYEPYLSQDFDWSSYDAAALRSAGLNALYEQDAKESEAAGEVGRLDFDPLINGQDYDITDLEIGDADIRGDQAGVLVSFANMGTRSKMFILLAREGDRWLIDDVQSSEGEVTYSLHDILSAPYP